MATKTKHLQLYKPAKNEYYDVDRDQNENFDKIDAKFEEVDNELKEKLNKGSYGGDADDLKREIDGKEPAFSKKSGFNLNKTDSYEEDDTNKVGTARALKRLYDWIRNKLANLTLNWDRITNKPNLMTSENIQKLLKNKVDKAGDTMTGVLNLKSVNSSASSIKHTIDTKGRTENWAYADTTYNVNDTNVFQQGIFGDKLVSQYVYFGKTYNDNMLRLYLDGKAILYANNLKTSNKEVIAGINELATNYKISAVGTTTDFLAKKSILVPKNAKKMLISHSNNSSSTSFTSKIVYDGVIITSIKQLIVDSTAEVQIIYNGADDKFFYYSLEIILSNANDNGISVWYSY